VADALRQNARIDLFAFDRLGLPILVAEVKAMAGASHMAIDWLMALAFEFRSAGHSIPYWMFVDLDKIQIFDGETRDSHSPLLVLGTADVLSVYEPDFRGKRIFDEYLLALVDRWLRDFSSDWRTTTPPAMNQLSKIGLAEKLKGGTTHREVSFAQLDPLRGNQFPDESFPGTRPGNG
jgi:hypothetical protein